MIKNITILILITSLSFSIESVAIVTKKIGNVKYTPFTSKDSTSNLNLSKALYNQDQIFTGGDGFTKVVYLDDGSTIKLHHDSNVFIQGSVKNRLITKQLNVYSGKMKFSINPQIESDFRIVTPSSVATIKGTRFWIDSNESEGDLFIGLSGIVKVKNIESGQVLELEPATTIRSLPDGTIVIEPTKILDLKVLEKLEEDVGELTEKDMNNYGNSSPKSKKQLNNSKLKSISKKPVSHSLRLVLTTDTGEEKDLIIKYLE